MLSRTLLWLFCAALLAFPACDQALALEASKVGAIGFNPFVVKTEGRKGTRIYTPDETQDYKALVEGEEKALTTHEPTPQEKIDQCMASWDTKTHITKANWRRICERQLSNGSL